MDNIKLYEIDPAYINYISNHAVHLFHNSTAAQANSRKYIGVIIRVNDMDYFAPLSSFKDKHKLANGSKTPLAKRTNDFELLESLCKNYRS